MSKKWGQHFLIEPRYIDQMLDTAQVCETDCILEIGPGKGILTKAMLQKKSRVTAVEIDPKLYQDLSQQLSQQKKFTPVHHDILQYDSQELLSFYSGPFKIVANLPYNIATLLFFKLMELREHLISVTVMVQQEVAERICATIENRKAYGVLSIAAEIGFERKLAFSIPPSAFSPQPKVNSAVVHLVPKARVISTEKEISFLRWVQGLFNQRRKTLLNNLQRCTPLKFQAHQTYLIKRYDKQRAETLTLLEFIELFDLMEK
ncbi:MAG: ribosomal RNA small subunit methyltransferase A [SAR324 cluster bacterium]|nr:ribosomal RNA small subunit methyltransferase A [SAR324 cluster bacterium]